MYYIGRDALRLKTRRNSSFLLTINSNSVINISSYLSIFIQGNTVVDECNFGFDYTSESTVAVPGGNVGLNPTDIETNQNKEAIAMKKRKLSLNLAFNPISALINSFLV